MGESCWFCPACGTKNAAGQEVCTGCGTKRPEDTRKPIPARIIQPVDEEKEE